MKQLLILSGKGGTGKTTVAGAFIKFSHADAFGDCDVDAPNLHLIIKQKTQPEKLDFFGLPKAMINSNLCLKCGLCKKHCRFDAVSENGLNYMVDPFLCEGCGVCEVVCKNGAVSMNPYAAGEVMLYNTDEMIFSTAQLKTGSGNSGKLVSEVKKQLRTAAAGKNLIIIDGSPGIGCPVISSMSGVDMVLIVAEPSVSGISDMKRILKTARVFGIKTAVCINKYDTNLKNTEITEEFCKNENIYFTGKIPYDKEAIKALNSGLSIADIDCSAGSAAKDIFKNTMELMFSEDVS